jgi:hypothetical protein
MISKRLGPLISGIVLMTLFGTSNADVITATLPETSVFPPMGPFTIGTFTFPTISLGDISSVSISGSFGNSAFATSSAQTPVLVDGVQVANCFTPGGLLGSNGCLAFSWSFDFLAGDFGLFTDGEALATGDFIAGGAVRIGELTLTITTGAGPAPVPEPPMLLLLGLAFAGIALKRSRRSRR